MICFKKNFGLLLALFAATAIYAQSASALEIPCARFKDKCKSLIPRLGLPKNEPGKYVIFDKTGIAPGYEAVVLWRNPVGQIPERWGVFIVDAAGKHVLTLETFPEGEASNMLVRLGKHSEGSLVVVGYNDHGYPQIKTKYLFDLGSRKKMGAIKAGVDVNIRYVIEFNGDIYCIGNTGAGYADANRALVAKISPLPAGQTSAQSAVLPAQSSVQAIGSSAMPMKIEILDKIDGRNLEKILDARKEGNKLIITGKQHRYTLTNDTWKASATPAPEAITGNYLPAWRKPDQGIKLPGHPWVIYSHEITNTKTKKSYSLPQPSYKLFSQWRPKRVRDGYSKDDASIESEIGPWQLVDGQLWFGLYFYDGEGSSGIGGYGTFDLATKKYQITYLKEIAGDSSSAILAEPETIWLGLVVQGEGWEFGTGLEKVGRRNNSVVRYKAPGMVNTFVRARDKVYAGTTDGLMVFDDDGRIWNIELSINKDGSYSPVVKQAADATYEE